MDFAAKAALALPVLIQRAMIKQHIGNITFVGLDLVYVHSIVVKQQSDVDSRLRSNLRSTTYIVIEGKFVYTAILGNESEGWESQACA